MAVSDAHRYENGVPASWSASRCRRIRSRAIPSRRWVGRTPTEVTAPTGSVPPPGRDSPIGYVLACPTIVSPSNAARFRPVSKAGRSSSSSPRSSSSPNATDSVRMTSSKRSGPTGRISMFTARVYRRPRSGRFGLVHGVRHRWIAVPGRAAAVLLLAASFVAPPPAAAQDPFAEVSALLDSRAEAMLDGDLEAFLATTDPADAAFAERQRHLFDGFQQLGLASYSLRLSDEVWPELTSSVEAVRYGPDLDPRVLHVEERYRLEGYDRAPALEDLYLTFIRRPEGWRIASDTDLDDLTLYSGRKLWENGPIITRDSEHFLYVSHPDQADAAGRILEASERALDRVGERWPVPWPERVPILAPSTTEELRRLIQATFDLDVFVAFASSSVDRARGWNVVGHRVILNWPHFSSFSEETQEDILTHELLHVATRGAVGPATPSFVEEGIAEWVSGDDDTAYLSPRVEAGTFDRALPEDHEFRTGSSADILSSYEESAAWGRFAVERYGVNDLAEFYRVLGEPRVAPGTWEYHVDRAARAAFGVSFVSMEARWADWVERTI